MGCLLLGGAPPTLPCLQDGGRRWPPPPARLPAQPSSSDGKQIMNHLQVAGANGQDDCRCTSGGRPQSAGAGDAPGMTTPCPLGFAPRTAPPPAVAPAAAAQIWAHARPGCLLLPLQFGPGQRCCSDDRPRLPARPAHGRCRPALKALPRSAPCCCSCLDLSLCLPALRKAR